MTSRLRDVLPITVGTYLVLLGAVFLLDSTGAHPIGVAGLVEAAIGLAMVALGVLGVLAALRVRRVSRRMRRAFGHVRSAEGWSIEDAVIQTVLGDIHLDLRDASLPEGETDLTLLCWIGAIHVVVPAGLGLDVTAQAIVGTVEVLGVREEGVIRDIHVRSDGFDEEARRLTMRLSTFVGELSVEQRGRPGQ